MYETFSEAFRGNGVHVFAVPGTGNFATTVPTNSEGTRARLRHTVSGSEKTYQHQTLVLHISTMTTSSLTTAGNHWGTTPSSA
jgi:hypothetical protein